MGVLEGRKIALIGGAGFIGHNLAIELSKQGASVTVVDSLAVNNYYHFVNNKDIIPHAELYLKIIQERMTLMKENNVNLIEADARDYDKLSHIMSEVYPDTVIQLAAVSHADVSNKDPHSTFDHSLRTLENALDISRSKQMGIKHFIYFSSSMVYGHFKSEFVTEETPCEPLGIYSALKYAGEKLVIAYNQVFDLPYTIVRPSALYGERCVSRRVGQIFIENALHGLDISVNGDGSDKLDFTYIGDLVHGIVSILTHDAAVNQIFNLTYGESRSIGEMADILKEHFPKTNISYKAKDKLTPDRGTLCVNKAKELIEYRPSKPLEVGYVDYIKWYKGMFE